MTLRILLVEDELLVALSLREALTEAGFEVDFANLGRTVTEHRCGARWDAALVDMCLPDQSGEAVVRYLRHHQPMLPIILTTGLETPETHLFASDHDLTILAKPFEEKALLELLRSLLVARERAQRMLPAPVESLS